MIKEFGPSAYLGNYSYKEKHLLLNRFADFYDVPFSYEESRIYEVRLNYSDIYSFKNLRNTLYNLPDAVINNLKKNYTLYVTTYNMLDYKELVNILTVWATNYNIANKIVVPTPTVLQNSYDKVSFIYVNSISWIMCEVSNNLDVQQPFTYNKLSDYLDNYKDIEYTNSKQFSCFMYSSKLHRLLTYSLLNKYNLIDKGYITWHGKGSRYDFSFNKDNISEYYRPLVNLDLFSLDELDIYYNKTIKDIKIQGSNPFKWHTDKSMLSKLKSSDFNIVTESTASNSHIFISEKTYQNFLLKKPFFLIGDKDSLSFLQKQLGFRTFNSLWNESYDNYESPILRTLYAFKEIKKVCKKGITKDISDILEHNYNTFMSLPHKKYIKQLLYPRL